jgi:cytochrome c oxidase cbb3-type subunit 3
MASQPLPACLRAALAAALLISPAFAQPPPGSGDTRAAAAGKEIFQQHCALCHGLNGGGGRGPDLRRATLDRAPTDDALRSLIQFGIPPDMPDGWYLSPDDVTNLAAFVRSLGRVPKENLPGDPARGELLYRRAGCSGCHILDGQGSGFGPELTGIGIKRGSARLRETLLHPAAALPNGFLMVEAVTSSGQTLRGIRLNEDSFTIQIKDAQNKIHSLRKSDLRALNKLRNQTPMPSFAAVFSPAELDDLVAFLASRQGRP